MKASTKITPAPADYTRARRRITADCDQAVAGTRERPEKMLFNGWRHRHPRSGRPWGEYFSRYRHASAVFHRRLFRLPRGLRGEVRWKVVELLSAELPLHPSWGAWRGLSLTQRYGRSVLAVYLAPRISGYLLTDGNEVTALTLGPMLPVDSPLDVSEWFTQLGFQRAPPGYWYREFPDGSRYLVADNDLCKSPRSELAPVRVGAGQPDVRRGHWLWFRNPQSALGWLGEVLRDVAQPLERFRACAPQAGRYDRMEPQLRLPFWFTAETARVERRRLLD
jgi:hypothetical protein